MKTLAFLFIVVGGVFPVLPANAAPPPRHAVVSHKIVVLHNTAGQVCFRGTRAALRRALLAGTLCR
jgi:hypothetical protein